MSSTRLASIVTAADDLESEDIVVPQWGVTLRMKSMDTGHRGAYLERLIAAKDEGNDVAMAQIQAELVVHGAFDPEDGSQAFDESDIPMLLTKHGGVVARLATVAQRLSGLDRDAEERLGKDSSASTEIPSDDSSSPSLTS